MELTFAQLKQMEPVSIFASGTGLYPEVENVPIKWVAVRGGIWDWCIYYLEENESKERIKTNGHKIFTKSIIKRLVPCTEEAFNMYRY